MSAYRSVPIALLVALWPTASRAAAVCDSNVMIVLDRSCSMEEDIGDGSLLSKWDLAQQAIQSMTTQYVGQLRLGLIMFPDEVGLDCVQDGTIHVAVGPKHEQAVVSAIAATTPTDPCVTNIDTAIAQVSKDAAFGPMIDPDGRRSFVLLITDGTQSGACGGSARDPVTAANIQALYDAGYPTYVVGFGGGVDPDALGLFALAGGVPRPGTPRYYQADNGAELQQALDAIAGDILADPEFGGCAGTPCPDGRCFGAGEQCVGGVCAPVRPDAGPGGGGGDDAGDGSGNGDEDDAGGGHGANAGDSLGCGCRVGGRAPVLAPSVAFGGNGVALGVGLAALLLCRRRRRGRR